MFTEKSISALALLKVVEKVPDEDIERIRWIQLNTHKEIEVSLWKLDRTINPTKGDIETHRHKLVFFKNNVTQEDIETGNGSVSLNEDAVQFYLCEAINEIHQIVTRNIKGYKEEMKMDFDLFNKAPDERFSFKV
jgi:hypothetical protein